MGLQKDPERYHRRQKYSKRFPGQFDHAAIEGVWGEVALLFQKRVHFKVRQVHSRSSTANERQ
jgi:hypothetical protein